MLKPKALNLHLLVARLSRYFRDNDPPGVTTARLEEPPDEAVPPTQLDANKTAHETALKARVTQLATAIEEQPTTAESSQIHLPRKDDDEDDGIAQTELPVKDSPEPDQRLPEPFRAGTPIKPRAETEATDDER